MLCIQTATTLDTEDRMRFEGHEFYFKSYEEMLRMLPDDAAALDETVRVAEKCNFDFTLGHNYMPNFDTPPGLDHKAYLRSLCEEGIHRRYPAAGAEVTERLDYELGVIDKMGYNTYFLIVWDFVTYAKATASSSALAAALQPAASSAISSASPTSIPSSISCSSSASSTLSA